MADGASRGIGAEGVSSRNAIASMASAHVVSFSKDFEFRVESFTNADFNECTNNDLRILRLKAEKKTRV